VQSIVLDRPVEPGKKLLVRWEPSALAEGSDASALRKRVGL
jgi:hypothetical protein